MSTENERLIVSVEARIRDVERNMAKVSKVFGDRFGQIEGRAKQSSDRLEKTMGGAANRMGIAMRAGLAGIFAGGVFGVGRKIAELAGGIAQIGDEAKRAGLSLRAFQELKFVAEQNRIGVDSLVDGIKELNLRADEFIVTGGGSAAEAFQRLGYDAATLRDKLRDPSALFSEIIGKLEQFDRAARIRVMDEIFGGTGGEKFVALVDRGEKAIRDQIRAANDLGVVMDDKLVEKADELDRKFRALTTTVSSGLKQAIVGAAFALQDFLDRFKEVENRQTATLQTQLAEAERNLKAAQERGIMPAAARQKQVEASQAEVDRLRNVLRDRALQTIRPQLESLRNTGAAPKGDRLGYTPPTPPSNNGRGGASRNSAADAAQRERQAVADLIAELEEELRLIGATDVERRAAEASRQAGAAATDEERRKIIALNEAIYQESAALDAQQQRMQTMADTARDFIGGFRQDIMNGVPPLEALGNAIGRLSDRIFDELLNAMFEVQNVGGVGGGFSGILGWFAKLFGFRTGGQIDAGKHTPVLRRAGGGMIYGPGGPTDDKVPVLASDGEYIVNAAATRKHRALIEAINAGKVASFAGGGIVGEADAPLAAGIGGQAISIVNNVKVEGGAGTPEQNADLARKMASQMEATMRGVVASEIAKQARPGNTLNRRGGR